MSEVLILEERASGRARIGAQSASGRRLITCNPQEGGRRPETLAPKPSQHVLQGCVPRSVSAANAGRRGDGLGIWALRVHTGLK